MKAFLRSRTFRTLRSTFGDRRAVDAIYVRAMQLTNNNTGIALLLATQACFDHQIVGLRVPLLSLALPLTNESDEEFNRRVRNLPTHLYPDTPTTIPGDRDKLQHFFGSAFVTLAAESEGTAERVGLFIEEGEEAFVLGGARDQRDARANLEGREFGKALLENNRRLPSEFLAGGGEVRTREGRGQ